MIEDPDLSNLAEYRGRGQGRIRSKIVGFWKIENRNSCYLSSSGSRLSRNVKSACVVYVMDSSHRNHRRAGT